MRTRDLNRRLHNLKEQQRLKDLAEAQNPETIALIKSIRRCLDKAEEKILSEALKNKTETK